MRGFWIALLAALGAALTSVPANGQAVGDREDVCGWVFDVESYRSNIAGLDIVLPANDRLIVNGRVLAERSPGQATEQPWPWEDSANGASVAQTSRYVLVKTFWTDCIDYASTRIYVLSRSGELIADSKLWSEHDSWSGFTQTRDGLMFSSEYYCGAFNRAPEGSAYVYVLRDGSNAFVREERPWASVGESSGVLPGGAIYFGPMTPISQPDTQVE